VDVQLRSSVSVVISAYNEEKTIALVLERLRKLEYVTEVVLVDNGSTDQTGIAIERSLRSDSRIRHFRIEKNEGLGCGLRLAIKNTVGDIVVRQDADLEYDPAELINLVLEIENGNADVVYGSRMLVRKAHKVHYYYSYLANIIISTFSNLLTNLFLSDVETAAKAFNGKLVRSLHLKSKGFEIENELTIKLKQMGCTFYEVPYSYYGRTFSEGKKIRAKDGFKAMYSIVYWAIATRIRKPLAKEAVLETK